MRHEISYNLTLHSSSGLTYLCLFQRVNDRYITNIAQCNASRNYKSMLHHPHLIRRTGLCIHGCKRTRRLALSHSKTNKHTWAITCCLKWCSDAISEQFPGSSSLRNMHSLSYMYSSTFLPPSHFSYQQIHLYSESL